MQPKPDLGLLDLAEIAIGRFQPLIQIVAVLAQGQSLGLQLLLQPTAQDLGPLTAEGAGLPVLVQQRLELQQGTMQPGSSQGGRQVIDDHGLRPALGLAALPRVIDDEGIEDRPVPGQRLGPAGVGQRDRLAGQPLQRAMRAAAIWAVAPETGDRARRVALSMVAFFGTLTLVSVNSIEPQPLVRTPEALARIA